MKNRLRDLYQDTVADKPIMVNPFIRQRVVVGQVDTGFTPVDEFLPFVFVRSVELFLAA